MNTMAMLLFFAQSPAEFAGSCANKTILGIPAWYNNVIQRDGNGSCGVNFDQGFDTFLVIGSNLIAAAIAVVGYVAIAYIIYAGVMFITAQGEPQGIASAKTRLQNAIIGLVITVFAFAIVSFVSGLFTVTGFIGTGYA